MGLATEDPNEICQLADDWRVTLKLMIPLARAARQFKEATGREPEVISGFRTAAEQKKLEAEGRPTAPDYLSTHRTCPATGADVRLGFSPTVDMIALWGRLLVENGIRWGGGSQVQPNGIPLDWQHADLGPRVLQGS